METDYILTDPNLDGDFHALIEARKKRNNTPENEAKIQELINDWKESNPQDPKTDTTAFDELRKGIFDEAMDDDVEKLKLLIKRAEYLKLMLWDSALRRPNDNATVLHYVLEKKFWKVADYLIRTYSKSDSQLLTENYQVTVRKVHSDKSCLHLLTEEGKCDLAKLLLERLAPKRELLNEFLRRLVLVDCKNQRPRDMGSMHIAARKGHKDLVQLFLKLGVDVNIPNNKKDTPVMWAVRENKIELVRYLIRKGAKLELENDKGSTALHWAVRYGYKDLVELLVSKSKEYKKRKLGLVAPIILASALGYHEIVEVLLNNGADANENFRQKQTALHVAAVEGTNQVVDLLLKLGKVEVDLLDCNGNTPILLAAKAGNIGTMQLLAENNANLDWKNKMGQNIWDFAMDKPNKDFLKAVAQLYRVPKRGMNVSRKPFVVVGKTPLHVAAYKGDVERMRLLLEIGVNPKAGDESGNTYFHVAARADRFEVVKAFLAEVDVDNPNNDGDTALHLSCKNGHLQTTQVLLGKAQVEARNKLGMTPLHEAAMSDAVSAELIREIVDRIVTGSNYSLLDARDQCGNTALHIAARRGRREILVELILLNPNVENEENDTPFHVAARSAIGFNTMIDVFNKPEKGVNLDQRNNVGDSCLHICARRGDLNGINILISCGADLGLKNDAGNTVVHVIVEESVKEPTKKEALLEVFRGITAIAVRWWCMKKDLQYPSEESKAYFSLLEIAMVHLTSEVYNREGLNAVSYAIKTGAVDLLDEILDTENVYRFRESKKYVYNITGFVPQTTNSNRNLSVKVGYDSYLDLVLSLEDEVLATKILDINPFRQLVRNYWITYQRIYTVLMIVHIVYMSLFSVCVVPASDNLHQIFNSSALPGYRLANSYIPYGIFLIWPIILLFYEAGFFLWILNRSLSAACPCCKHDGGSNKKETQDSGCCASVTCARLCGLPYLMISTLFGYLGHLTALAFCSLVIAWYILFRISSNMSTYVQIVSMVMLFGWLFTINFTKGFENIHVYSIMLKCIVSRDITRYLIVYIFFLLGCGLAFNVLFQIIPTTDPNYNYSSVWNTLFNVFNLMLGLGSLFDDSFDSIYKEHGGDPTFVKWLYIFYIISATVILMSLLVAMMTDTYTDIKAKEGTTWKVGSLRLALQIERRLFCKKMQQLLRATTNISYDSQEKRWKMTIDADQVGPGKIFERDELLKTVQRLENKVDRIQECYAELSSQIAPFDLSKRLPPRTNTCNF